MSSKRGSAKKSASKKSAPTSRKGRSYRRKTTAKKHGTMRSYLKGKDMKKNLSPILESPNIMSPESKRLRRLGFYSKDGKLPKSPRMRKSAREKFWTDIAGERRYKSKRRKKTRKRGGWQ